MRQIQELTLERAKLQRQEGASRELESIERTLEQLRWRLADVARGQATDDLDSAA